MKLSISTPKVASFPRLAAYILVNFHSLGRVGTARKMLDREMVNVKHGLIKVECLFNEDNLTSLLIVYVLLDAFMSLRPEHGYIYMCKCRALSLSLLYIFFLLITFGFWYEDKRMTLYLFMNLHSNWLSSVQAGI